MEIGQVVRYAQLVALAFILVGRTLITCQTGYKISGMKDKGLDNDYLILPTSNAAKTVSQCLALCLNNCSCLSFEMHRDQCELYRSSKFLGAAALVSKPGTVRFTIERKQKEANKQCGEPCSRDINCCHTDRPCRNGGTCYPAGPEEKTTRRFGCKCPRGFNGPRCGNRRQVTCQDIMHKEDKTSTGGYRNFSNGGNHSYFLLCDFRMATGMAWTMVSSLDTARKTSSKSLALDNPLSDGKYEFNNYRLSYEKMAAIRNASRQWRVTCNVQDEPFNQKLMSTKDHVIGTNADVDILSNQSRCSTVEKIVIPEHECAAPDTCRVKTVQGSEGMLYFSFDDTTCSSGPADGKRYFGLYNGDNHAHPCSSTDKATTGIWFGGWK